MTDVDDRVIWRGWDLPWYRIRTAEVEVSFLPDAGEALDAVCNVDVFVRLAADGSNWTATVFTAVEVERLLRRWSGTGDMLNGRYFWCSDGLIVRDPGVESIAAVLIDLHATGELVHILQRADD